MMKFKDILAEELMLMENVAQAEKVLKDLNIPLDDPEYLRIKNKVVADNSVGFLGFMFNLMKNWANEVLASDKEDVVVPPMAIFGGVDTLYDLIKKHRQELHLLPQNINNYKDYKQLVIDLRRIPTNKTLKKFANLIPNKDLKNRILDIQSTGKYADLIKRYLDVIHDTPYGKMFLKKINRYSDIDKLFDYLETVEMFYNLDISYESILGKANSRDDLQLVYNKGQRVILLIKSYDAMREVGSPSWCIYDSRSQYDSYTDGGSANQYIFYDFGDEVPSVSYSMIGFTMKGAEIIASHLMDDQHISDVMSYLNKIGVYPKLKIINVELERIRKNKDAILTYTNELDQLMRTPQNDQDSRSQLYGKYKELIQDVIYTIVNDIENYISVDEFFDGLGSYFTYDSDFTNHGSLATQYRALFSKFLNANEKMNYNLLITKLTNIISFLQDYRYMKFEWDYSPEGDYQWYKLIEARKVNLLYKGFFDKLDRRPDLLTALKKVFINFKGIQPQTYATLIDTFYNWDVAEDEVNKLIRLRKTKQGEDYSDVEFHRIKDTGDLSSIILKKLQDTRRGQDAGLTYQQVKYGIDKGLKNILFNHYKKVLPYFMEQQVDYDHAKIYQSLGLSKDLKDVVLKKYNMMGGNQNPYSINSIERSILDVG